MLAYAVRMATNPAQDPIGEEAERVIRDPGVQRRLEEFERRLTNGEVRTVPHEEVRRRLRMDEKDKPASR
jgi:hypothetical protein